MQETTRQAAYAALAVLALAGAAAACASSKRQEQRADTPPAVAYDRSPERRQMRLFEGITLTDLQRASIDSIRAAYRERMGPLPGDRRRGDGPPARPRDRGDFERRRSLMEEQRAAIRNVLTPEQQRIFDANVEKMRQERGGDRRDGPPPDDRRD